MLTNETSNVHVQQAQGKRRAKGGPIHHPMCAQAIVAVPTAVPRRLYQSMQPPDMHAWRPTAMHTCQPAQVGRRGGSTTCKCKLDNTRLGLFLLFCACPCMCETTTTNTIVTTATLSPLEPSLPPPHPISAVASLSWDMQQYQQTRLHALCYFVHPNRPCCRVRAPACDSITKTTLSLRCVCVQTACVNGMCC